MFNKNDKSYQISDFKSIRDIQIFINSLDGLSIQDKDELYCSMYDSFKEYEFDKNKTLFREFTDRVYFELSFEMFANKNFNKMLFINRITQEVEIFCNMNDLDWIIKIESVLNGVSIIENNFNLAITLYC